MINLPKFPSSIRSIALFNSLFLLSLSPLCAQVLDLEFSGGNGTTSVDQFEGISGSGWNTAWSETFHSGTANGNATVTATNPMVSGGGNYLSVSYDTQASGTRLARLARQWDTSALSLTTPIVISFDIRSNVDVSSSAQYFTLFGSSSSTPNTSSNDSWKITADGGGWKAYNGTESVNFNTGTIQANDTWHISMTIDPVADTYDASVQNITQSGSILTLTDLALRNGSESSLSFLNIHGYAAASLSGNEYSIDNVSVSSIPEPSTAAGAIAIVSILAFGLYRHRRSRI